MYGYAYAISDPAEGSKTDDSGDQGNNPSNRLKQGALAVIPSG